MCKVFLNTTKIREFLQIRGYEGRGQRNNTEAGDHQQTKQAKTRSFQQFVVVFLLQHVVDPYKTAKFGVADGVPLDYRFHLCYFITSRAVRTKILC